MFEILNIYLQLTSNSTIIHQLIYVTNIADRHCKKKINKIYIILIIWNLHLCSVLQEFLERNRDISTQLQRTTIFTKKVFENYSNSLIQNKRDSPKIQENGLLKINKLTFKVVAFFSELRF